MSPITELVLQSTWETVVMVFFSTLFAVLLGFPLGIFLFVTSPRGIAPKIVPYQLISRIVNTLRSFPFVILMIVMFPLSRVVLGTAIGTEATIIPLSVAAAPFIARLTETALNEVDKGVIGASVNYFGYYLDDYYADWLFCDGGGYWRGRPWRPCHPLWLPAIPHRCDD